MGPSRAIYRFRGSTAGVRVRLLKPGDERLRRLGWLVVSVEQLLLEEFFVGQTDTGRSVHLYGKSTAHETLMDSDGTPFEISGGFLLFGTLDREPITIETISTRQDFAALVVTPTGPIAAVAPGTDPAEAKSALTALAQKAPIRGWTIDCVAEQVDDQGTYSFILKVRNELVATEIAVKLAANVAAAWQGHSGHSLRDVVIANETRRLRRWSMRRIQEEGSHQILAGRPLT